MRKPVIVITVAVVVLMAGCRSGQEPVSPSPSVSVAPTQAPTPTQSAVTTAPPTPATPTASATAEPAAQARLEYYLVRESGTRIFVEPVVFTYDRATVGQGVAREAMTRLLGAPATRGLVNLVPAGTTLRDIAVADGLLRVDLSAEVATNPGVGAEGEQAFQQMLAHTGAQFSTVDRVVVLVDGQPITDLWGHVDWSMPFQADPFAVSPIVISQAMGVAQSGTHGGLIELSGTANVFEATFDLEVTDGSGAVVESQFATATCGTGCRGEWQATISNLDPGPYTVTAREQDASDGEGFAPFEVSLRVTVP
ncbi:MAG: Gmad2 immunoglobulin-like domain-containing protein [Euzebya sp.]